MLAKKNQEREDAEGEVERPGSAAAKDEAYDGGTNDEDVGYPFVDAQGSLVVHSVGITILRKGFHKG